MGDYGKEAIRVHAELKGKISIVSKKKITTKEDLSILYTPGVAEPCREIAKNKDLVFAYTSRWNIVAVISDGSAVLGLGNIGPEAGLPVMEGKAVLFKEFGGIDSIPLCLATQDPDEIIRTVELLAPSLGGVNLEDISAPRCFRIETELQKRLSIPVFHDDQHGTAIVTLAGLINALKVYPKDIKTMKIVICGAGAAGIAITKILYNYGMKNIVLTDSKGIVSSSRNDLNQVKQDILSITNLSNESGTLKDAVRGASVFIGVSGPNILDAADIASMAGEPFVFAMSNPVPEVPPHAAKSGGAVIVATGRSDYPNQINNVLAFPGIFRGALDVGATAINEDMKRAAAEAIAKLVSDNEIGQGIIIPSPLNRKVAEAVALATAKAAMRTGVARLSPDEQTLIQKIRTNLKS